MFIYEDWATEVTLDPAALLPALKEQGDERIDALIEAIEEAAGLPRSDIECLHTPGIGQFIEQGHLEEWATDFASTCGAVSLDHPWLVIDGEATARELTGYGIEIDHDGATWLLLPRLDVLTQGGA